MNFDISLTASSMELFATLENKGLTLLNGTWGKELDLTLKNPYIKDYAHISKSDFGSCQIQKLFGSAKHFAEPE